MAGAAKGSTAARPLLHGHLHTYRPASGGWYEATRSVLYDLLFRTSAAALQKLASDPRFVGGQIGMVGVLHTWKRDLNYHPHVHYLVPAGGLSEDGQTWLPVKKDFLVPVKPLSILFRAKFRDALKKTDLFAQVPNETWTQDWVVHCQPVGNGMAALKYLAPLHLSGGHQQQPHLEARRMVRSLIATQPPTQEKPVIAL